MEFKQKVVGFYKENGIGETIRVYNIGNETVYKWLRKSESWDFMRKTYSKYTLSQKLDIITYNKRNGSSATEEKYNISPSVFNRWERILFEYGEDELAKFKRGYKPKGPKKDVNKNKDLLEELHYLRMENDYLKKLKALVEKREDQERKSK